MIKVGSCQFNYSYRSRVFFPYSIAMLISYIKTKKELAQNLKFERTFVLREKVDDDIQKCKDLEILLCSFFGFYKILSKSKYRIKERQDNQRVRFQKEIQNVSGVDELSF